jgi:TonB family protein
MSQRNERSTRPNISSVTHWLIHQAAHRTPESLSSRLEEEWLADLESRSAPLSRLRFAAGCCWSSLVIVNEYSRNPVAATSPAAAARGFVILADRNFGYFSLRSATLFVIAGLHAALFFGLVTTLSHTRGTLAPPNLQNHDVTPLPREKVPVTPPGTEFKDWTIYLPKLVVDTLPKIDFDNDAVPDVTETPREAISEPGPSEKLTHVVRQLAGGPGVGFPETADFYPSPSIRLGEEGMSIVQVCVDRKGRLSSEPSTVKGSGSARLDEAALKLARAGSGHYRATTEDGQPVNSCYAFGVRFQLRK